MGVCFREILPSTQNWSSAKVGVEFCISSLETGDGNLCSSNVDTSLFVGRKRQNKNYHVMN